MRLRDCEVTGLSRWHRRPDIAVTIGDMATTRVDGTPPTSADPAWTAAPGCNGDLAVRLREPGCTSAWFKQRVRAIPQPEKRMTFRVPEGPLPTWPD